MLKYLKNSRILRWPLLAATRWLMRPLHTGWPLLRRAAYDSLPLPFIVAGDREHFVVSTADKVIGRELFLHGQFDFDKLETALAILQRECVDTPTHLIDVGANIGSIVVPALSRGLFQSATAVEPHPTNLRLLRANLALNGVQDRATVFDLAAGERPDVVLHLQESRTNSGNHAIGGSGLAIRSTRLDDLPLPAAPSLLWMDIEGYEGHALAGAGRLLAAGTPVVAEVNADFLRRSGGLAWFRDALGRHRLFDLNRGGAPVTLATLLDAPDGSTEPTDILALRD